MGVPKAIGSDVPNLVKDLPNLMKDLPNFMNNVPNFERCTNGSKVRSEVGIDPQSLPYGFQKEIMDHPCLNGGGESNSIGCTKFNEGCTKFCEGCTKRSKVRSEVGINPQSLPYGF